MANARKPVNVIVTDASMAVSGPLNEQTGPQGPQIGRKQLSRVAVRLQGRFAELGIVGAELNHGEETIRSGPSGQAWTGTHGRASRALCPSMLSTLITRLEGRRPGALRALRALAHPRACIRSVDTVLRQNFRAVTFRRFGVVHGTVPSGTHPFPSQLRRNRKGLSLLYLGCVCAG